MDSEIVVQLQKGMCQGPVQVNKPHRWRAGAFKLAEGKREKTYFFPVLIRFPVKLKFIFSDF